MHFIEILGYLASGAVFVSLWMKAMIPLRTLGLCSNVLFFSYGLYDGLTPIIILHGCLFPLNTLRLYQALKLKRSIHAMAESEFNVNSLLPLMTKHKLSKSSYLFKRGDDARQIYFLTQGLAHVSELDIYIQPGQLIGEIAMFTPDKKRTQTIECVEDCIFMCIEEEKVLQIFMDNPEFGLCIIKMIVARLLGNSNSPAQQQDYSASLVSAVTEAHVAKA